MNLNEIKIFCSDIDGVWTDGSMYYSEKGDEMKKFHTYDSAGVLFLKKTGIETAIITQENTKIVKRRCDKLNITKLYQGITNKVVVCEKICAEKSIDFNEVAYIGDDINDIALIKKVGLSACPNSAPQYVQELVDWIIPVKGGDGAFRYFVEKFLKEIGKFDKILKNI